MKSCLPIIRSVTILLSVALFVSSAGVRAGSSVEPTSAPPSEEYSAEKDIVSVLYVPVWYYLCVAEERDLLIRYGTAYEEYCRRVGFWIPKS